MFFFGGFLRNFCFRIVRSGHRTLRVGRPYLAEEPLKMQVAFQFFQFFYFNSIRFSFQFRNNCVIITGGSGGKQKKKWFQRPLVNHLSVTSLSDLIDVDQRCISAVCFNCWANFGGNWLRKWRKCACVDIEKKAQQGHFQWLFCRSRLASITGGCVNLT